MNLIQFLTQVDEVVSRLSQKELEAFIHETARTLPESKRKVFLEKLNAVSGKSAEANQVSYVKALSEKELKKHIARLSKELRRIESGELCFNSSLNEEYNDYWYDEYENSNDEFIFEDPDGIAQLLETGCKLVHQCIDTELYSDGYMLFDQLICLDITVDGDYADYGNGEWTLYDAIDELQLDIDTNAFTLDGLYAAYLSTPLKKRPKCLYSIFYDAGCKKVTMEALIQHGGKELPEWKTFLNEWINYLGRQEEPLSDVLLNEALSLQNDPEHLLVSARNFADFHPELYEQYLTMGIDRAQPEKTKDVPGNNFLQDEELLIIGQEALDTISSQYTLRSRIACLTAVYALRTNQTKIAETCWLEAFRSNTDVTNYLRLRTESSDFVPYIQEVNRIIQEYEKKTARHEFSYNRRQQFEKNELTSTTYFALTFFQGDFTKVLQEGMNVTEALGWSATFMKTGIALFLLYLYSGTNTNLPAGCSSMVKLVITNCGFSQTGYAQGLIRPVTAETETLFWDCFCQWKSSVSILSAPISAEEEEKLIQKLEQWILLRLQGIMQKQHRNYYGECAEFIAALGEVKESRGEINGKARFMETCKQAYPRHRAFHGELRRLGMRK